MKRIYILLVSITGFLFLSCENFRDNNGELGGTWQLLQWRTRSSSGNIDSLVANNISNDTTLENYRKLYYSIHRDVFQIRDASTFENMRYFFTYTRTADSLILGDMVNSYGEIMAGPSSQEKDYDLVKSFGVPHDGHFKYHLDGNNLMLSTKDDVLTFRRY